MNSPRLLRATSSLFLVLRTSARGISSGSSTPAFATPAPLSSRWNPAHVRSSTDPHFDAIKRESSKEAESEITMAATNPKLGFIGAGMMASAMINGVIAAKLTKPENIIVSDLYKPSLERLAASGVRTCEGNAEVVLGCDVLVLAVKPDVIPAVLKEIAQHLTANSLVVSIAAGITLATLESFVPGARVVRVMPNTPCLVAEGAAAFSLGSCATEADKDVVQSLLGSVGYACSVKESQLDAVTGVSGCGPAYVFMMIEALADGGVRMGLPRNVALKLAAQTLKGAATMVLETGTHPGVLKDQVCSPGGVTITAVESLEKNGFRSAAMSAVITAANKSIDMGKK